MMNKLIFITILFLSSHAFADCGNGFECVKSGDEALANGNFSRAIENYKVACELGLRAGCESVEETKQKNAKFQKSSDISSNKSTPFNAFDVVGKCTAENASEADCLKKARELRQKGFTKASIEIQRHYCDLEQAQFCFELGVTLVKVEDQDGARKAYLSACSLGETKACDVSKSIAASIDIEETRQERERNKKQQELAEQRRIREAEEEQDRKRSQAILEASQQIGIALSGAKSDADLDRELKQKQLDSFNQPNNHSKSFRNKKKCTTTKSVFGNSLETSCEDSY